MQDIYLSKINESDNIGIVIEGDDHSIWAYLLEIKGNKQRILFDGFICSRGTIVNSTDQVKSFLKEGISPPLNRDYINEYSVEKEVVNEDFEILIEKNEIQISMKSKVYLIMDLEEKKSYSKSISRIGPYGYPLDEYGKEKK